ncbi:MAG: hypothetical protein JWN93_198 [Hyphomicrobiales bacterium]|nr:hypothetical protein [Hyphomicrobiales bacterium]
MRSAFTIITLLACLGGAHAQGVTIFGGQTDCATWTRDVGARGPASEWVFGFLSGYNAALAGSKNVLEPYSTETLTKGIDKFCAQFPNERIATGAVQLALEVKRRAGLR